MGRHKTCTRIQLVVSYKSLALVCMCTARVHSVVIFLSIITIIVKIPGSMTLKLNYYF